MTNMEVYKNAFVDLFGISEPENLKYQEVPQWDSVGHMELVARLETDFQIMIDMDDVIDFSSFSKGIEIVKKYGVVI